MPMPPKMAWATMIFWDEVQSLADVEAPLPVTGLVAVAVGSIPVPAAGSKDTQHISQSERQISLIRRQDALLVGRPVTMMAVVAPAVPLAVLMTVVTGSATSTCPLRSSVTAPAELCCRMLAPVSAVLGLVEPCCRKGAQSPGQEGSAFSVCESTRGRERETRT